MAHGFALPSRTTHPFPVTPFPALSLTPSICLYLSRYRCLSSHSSTLVPSIRRQWRNSEFRASHRGDTGVPAPVERDSALVTRENVLTARSSETIAFASCFAAPRSDSRPPTRFPRLCRDNSEKSADFCASDERDGTIPADPAGARDTNARMFMQMRAGVRKCSL